MKRNILTRRAGAVLGVATLALVAWPSAAHGAASVASGKQPGRGTAVVRAAHFSPDTPGVDVYLTSFSGSSSNVWQKNVGYGDVTSYRSLKPGLYIVAMRLHGASPSSPPGLKWTLNARAGQAYTVAAAGMNAHLTGVVLHDTLKAPASGHGLVRVIQASSRAMTATLVAAPHTVLAADAKFASSTGYKNVPAGTWTVKASSVTASAVSTSKRVTVSSGTISSVVVLDSKGDRGIQIRKVEDASGAAIAPQGSIDAGGGGTAPRPALEQSAAPVVAVVAVVAVLGAAFLVRRRQTGRS